MIVPVTNWLIRGQLVNSLVRRKQWSSLIVPVMGSSGVTKMDVLNVNLEKNHNEIDKLDRDDSSHLERNY